MKGRFLFSLILFFIWFLLNYPLNKESFISGVVLAGLLSVIFYRRFAALKVRFSVGKVFWAVVYLFVLFGEIIKANLDVAWRLLHPKMPIRPGIVEIKTTLKSDFARVVLANSITLTPGTFTLDILGDSLLIHWIDVKAEDREGASQIITGRFEKFLKRIFE